jgi:aromatic ring-opening dioxygenase catalytic subunit (LigB family)
MEAEQVQPAWLITHGAGPCFYTRGGTFAGIDADSKIAADMKEFAKTLPRKPRALLVISAHHEVRTGHLELVGDTDDVVPLLYDYGGFPPETYAIQWPAKGSSWLAAQVRALLAPDVVTSNNARGFDHGVFVPLKLVFPDADIPTLQLSLSSSLDPEYHARIGAKLAALRKQNVLIVGSGSATHGRGGGGEREFVDWLSKHVADPEQLKVAHKTAPHFASCHPRTEHWIPFVVASAAVGGKAKEAKLLCSGWWQSLALYSWALS